MLVYLMHFWLGVFATFGAILLFTFAVLNEVLTRKRSEQASQSHMHAHNFAEESRRNAEVVKAMGMLSSMRARWSSLRATALKDHDWAGDRGGAITSSSKVVRLFLQSAMLALGAYLATLQEITPGVMIAASIVILVGVGIATLQKSLINH